MESNSVYTPLNHARREIRLMRITSRAASKAIHCELRVYDLEDSPTYSALSYTWGPKHNLQRIRLNGHEFMIRPNLSEFLQVYRTYQDRGLIWIDQLCIDQGTTQERNHQVAMMDRIYRGAERTLVWLGPDPYDGRAFALMREAEFMAGDHGFDKRTQAWLDLEKNAREAIYALFRIPYWRRLWVAQEVILSREPVLCYGYSMMPWKELALRYSDLLVTYEIPNVYLTSFSIFDYLVDTYDDQPCASLENFEKMALFVETSFSEDPRDKVFGIQSVLPAEMQVSVDYRSSVRAIYLAMVNARFHHHPEYGVYNFLSYCISSAQGMRLTKLRNAKNRFGLARDQFLDHLLSKGHSKETASRIEWLTQEELMEFLETRVLDDSRVSESQL